MEVYRTLYDLAKLLLAETDPGRTAALLLEQIRERIGAERGFIVVREGDRFVRKLDVAFDAAKVSAPERRFSRSIVKAAIDSRQVVASDSPQDDLRFIDADSVHGLGPHSVRAVPFIHEDHVVGVLYLERASGVFGAETGTFLVEVAGTAAALLARALDRDALRRRNRELERDLFAQHDFRGILTRDPAMTALLRMVAQVADSDASILVRGETGAGKELIARALHVNSSRRRGPFVTVHCSALPDTLLESELFGHVRGAFTGADRDRAGRIAQAQGGVAKARAMQTERDQEVGASCRAIFAPWPGECAQPVRSTGARWARGQTAASGPTPPSSPGRSRWIPGAPALRPTIRWSTASRRWARTTSWSGPIRTGRSSRASPPPAAATPRP